MNTIPMSETTRTAHAGEHKVHNSDTLPGEIRTGSIAEIGYRADAWLAWRAGRAPKPAFKYYDPRNPMTWFRPPTNPKVARRAAQRRERALRGLAFANIANEMR